MRNQLKSAKMALFAGKKNWYNRGSGMSGSAVGKGRNYAMMGRYNAGYAYNLRYDTLRGIGHPSGRPGRFVCCDHPRFILSRLLRAGWEMPSIREAWVWFWSARRIASSTSCSIASPMVGRRLQPA